MQPEYQLNIRSLVDSLVTEAGLYISSDCNHMIETIITRTEQAIQEQPERELEATENLLNFIKHMIEISNSRDIPFINLQIVEEIKLQVCPLWPIC